MCVSVREREREYVCLCFCALCVCVCDRERKCVCVCACERREQRSWCSGWEEGRSLNKYSFLTKHVVCVWLDVCVREREGVWEGVCKWQEGPRKKTLECICICVGATTQPKRNRLHINIHVYVRAARSI